MRAEAGASGEGGCRAVCVKKRRAGRAWFEPAEEGRVVEWDVGGVHWFAVAFFKGQVW